MNTRINSILLKFSVILLNLIPMTTHNTAAYAQDENKNKPTRKKDSDKAKRVQKESEKKSTKLSDLSTSDQVRSQKKIVAEALFTPVSDFYLIFGARGSYRLSSKLVFDATYLGGFRDQKKVFATTPELNVAKADVTGMAVAGGARYFIGNSFSIQGGVGFRSANAIVDLSDPQGNTVNFRQTISSVVALGALGNHWSWPNGLTVGCDWVAVMIPLTSSMSYTLDSNMEQIGSDPSKFTAAGEKVSKATSLTLGLLSIGFGF